jgi:transposase-like protein
VPKSVQAKEKEPMQNIWMAGNQEKAYTAFDNTVKRFEGKYQKAMSCLLKDKAAMLALYDFPAQRWLHIRTSKPIESTFSTARLRTTKRRNCVSRENIFAMVFKLAQGAEKRWKRLHGVHSWPILLRV